MSEGRDRINETIDAANIGFWIGVIIVIIALICHS